MAGSGAIRTIGSTWNGVRVDGVLYPRAGTLGGCTAHNAMILVCPHDSDWNQLADLTGDPSWRAERMREHFERLENCDYRAAGSRAGEARHQPEPSRLGRLAAHASAPCHGRRCGTATFGRPSSIRLARRSKTHQSGPASGCGRSPTARPTRTTGGVASDESVGVRFTPMTTHDTVRVGSARAAARREPTAPGPAEDPDERAGDADPFRRHEPRDRRRVPRRRAVVPRPRAAERHSQARCARPSRRARSSWPAASSTPHSC